jgi:hypothetical protein
VALWGRRSFLPLIGQGGSRRLGVCNARRRAPAKLSGAPHARGRSLACAAAGAVKPCCGAGGRCAKARVRLGRGEVARAWVFGERGDGRAWNPPRARAPKTDSAVPDRSTAAAPRRRWRADSCLEGPTGQQPAAAGGQAPAALLPVSLAVGSDQASEVSGAGAAAGGGAAQRGHARARPLSVWGLRAHLRSGPAPRCAARAAAGGAGRALLLAPALVRRLF